MKEDRLSSIPPLQWSIKQRIAIICYVIVFGFFAFFGLVIFGAGESGVGISFLGIAIIMLVVEFLLVRRRWKRALNYLLHARLSELNIPPSSSEKQEPGQLLLVLRWRDIFKFWGIGVIVLLIVSLIAVTYFLHVFLYPYF